MEDVNAPVEKSVLVVERKVPLLALVERKVSFPVVVKGNGKDGVTVEVNEPVAAMSHNEEQGLVV